jgi:tetratricopeptide (TPR) repeat protein
MALEDRYGNALGTGSDTARDHYVIGVDCLLSANHGGRQAFEAAIAADPGFALGHVGLARAAMVEADMAAAKAAFAEAEALSGGLSERELGHIEALRLVLSGQAAAARDHIRAHVARHPRDALSVQLCASVFGLIGFSGCPGREADLLAYTASLLPHYGEDWWMMSMHAISLCESGRVGPALALMDRALTLNPRNANAAHFKAHSHYEMGDVADGRAFLTAWLEPYDRRSVLFGHLSWHAALWALAAGDIDGLWAAIDGAIMPGTTEAPPINVLTDAAAILHRAEIAGVPVPQARWQQISDYAAVHFVAPGQSFADMHAALAHAMAGETGRLAAIEQAEAGFAADLVRPVAAAWGAMARGDWEAALHLLTPAMADHARLGGSRAQRDLLEFAYANTLLKLGRTDEARRLMAMRRAALAEVAPVAGLH